MDQEAYPCQNRAAIDVVQNAGFSSHEFLGLSAQWRCAIKGHALFHQLPCFIAGACLHAGRGASGGGHSAGEAA